MEINFSLRLESDPILYQKLEEFNFDSGQDTHEIERQMIEIMLKSNGIGISANQVGFNKRVIVIWPKQHQDIKEPFALFNPKIVNLSKEEQDDTEGCLSFPSLLLKVKRSETITVEYLDKNKNPSIIKLSGYDARCAQHELDHLDGICFTSKVSSLKLNMARKRQRKIENGRTK